MTTTALPDTEETRYGPAVEGATIRARPAAWPAPPVLPVLNRSLNSPPPDNDPPDSAARKHVGTYGPEPAPAAVTVTHEPDMYRPAHERGSEDPDFWADVAAGLNDSTPGGSGWEAMRRLRAHHHAHNRDTTSANFPGMVVPEYVGEEITLLAQSPVMHALDPDPLPPNRNEMRIPTVTLNPTTDKQTAENAIVSETDMTTGEKVLTVNAYAAAQQVSMQAVELSGGEVPRLVARAAAETAAAAIEDDILSSAASSGGLQDTATYLAANRLARTDASPTAAKVAKAVYDLILAVFKTRNASPDLLIMHPRRLEYLMDSNALWDQIRNTLPAVPLPGEPHRYLFGGETNMWGIPVIASNDMATNLGASSDEDRIIALRRADYPTYMTQPRLVIGHADGVGASAASTGINTLTNTLAVYYYWAGGLANNAGGGILSGTLLAV